MSSFSGYTKEKAVLRMQHRFGDYFRSLSIRQPAQPCWNGGIWYRRTHGTEYR